MCYRLLGTCHTISKFYVEVHKFSANKSQTICILNLSSAISQILLYNFPLMKQTSTMIALISSKDTIDTHIVMQTETAKTIIFNIFLASADMLKSLNCSCLAQSLFPQSFSTSNWFLFQSDEFKTNFMLLSICYFYNIRTTKTVKKPKHRNK